MRKTSIENLKAAMFDELASVRKNPELNYGEVQDEITQRVEIYTNLLKGLSALKGCKRNGR